MKNKNYILEQKIILRKILNKHDPIHIYFGKKINPDEYDLEIEKILLAFNKNNNLEKFTEKVYTIFIKMFSPKIAGDRSKYVKLAEEICNYLKK